MAAPDPLTRAAAKLPYYQDDAVTLFHGDCREIVPALGVDVDLIVADPPYGETSLEWDRWPNGWPDAIRTAANSMWCFGSMRMFLHHRDEFLQRISAAQVHATLALVATRAGNYTKAGQDYIDSVNAGIKSAKEFGLI